MRTVHKRDGANGTKSALFRKKYFHQFQPKLKIVQTLLRAAKKHPTNIVFFRGGESTMAEIVTCRQSSAILI
jgi:hypothetical protein